MKNLKILNSNQWHTNNMGRLNVLVFIPVFFSSLVFMIPNIAGAVSGTCSWHGGVNCSAGADWDGSTVCNDGWRDSSEIYSQMEGCKTNNHYCTQSELDQIYLKYDISKKSQDVRDLTNQLDALNTEIITKKEQLAQNPNALMPAIVGQQAQQEKDNAIKALTLSSQLQTKQGNLTLALSQADRECYALGDAEYLKNQHQELLRSLEERLIQIDTPQYTCPANSTLNGTNCSCDEGYVFNGNVCVTYTQNCQVKYGTNSYGDKQFCHCFTGYEWNSSQTSCDKVEVQSVPPTVIGKFDNIFKQSEPPTKTITLSAPIKVQIKKSTEVEISNETPEVKNITNAATTTLTISPSEKVSSSTQVQKQEEERNTSIKSIFIRFFKKLKFW